MQEDSEQQHPRVHLVPIHPQRQHLVQHPVVGASILEEAQRQALADSVGAQRLLLVQALCQPVHPHLVLHQPQLLAQLQRLPLVELPPHLEPHLLALQPARQPLEHSQARHLAVSALLGPDPCFA